MHYPNGFRIKEWLSAKDLLATGAVIAVSDRHGKRHCAFLELKSCNDSVRIANHGDIDDFITKLTVIRNAVDGLISHLSESDIHELYILREQGDANE